MKNKDNTKDKQKQITQRHKIVILRKNFGPHNLVTKRLLQICPQDTTKLLGSTDSNSKE